MKRELHENDLLEQLNDAEALRVFIEKAFATRDADYIAKALGLAAKSKGMSEMAEKTGISKEQLSESLSENGNPTLKTVLSVLGAMGFGIKPYRREAIRVIQTTASGRKMPVVYVNDPSPFKEP
jgi:probable addiction module antidote protein